MNFLKISGLVLGTISVAGVTGTGIYYADSSKTAVSSVDTASVNPETASDNGEVLPNIVNDTHTENLFVNTNRNTPFVGKIVFYKKSGTGENATYEAKLMNVKQYEMQKTTFDKNKSDENKYDKVHKIIDISVNLDSVEARKKLRAIFTTPSLLSDIKLKLTSKETELKSIFDDAIYSNLRSKFAI